MQLINKIKSQNIFACMTKVKTVASVPYKCQILLQEFEQQCKYLELVKYLFLKGVHLEEKGS